MKISPHCWNSFCICCCPSFVFILPSLVWNTTMVAPVPESGRSDATLQPPGTDWGQNTCSPSSVNPFTTSIFPTELSIKNASSRHPTPEHAQAIAALKNHNSGDIQAWHAHSQSTVPGLKHLDGPDGLSVLEIHATSTLRGCSKESLIEWLGPRISSTNFLGSQR